MLKIHKPKMLVVPDKFLNNFVTDFYEHLASIIVSVIPDIQIVKTSEFNPDKDLNLAFLISVAHWPVSEQMKIKDIPPKTKVMCWYDDVFWINENARKLNIYLFDRADYIFHSSKSTFLDMWSKYESKSYWLPFFASPYFYNNYPIQPTPRCLLTGSCSEYYYPLRKWVKDSKSKFVDVLEHPGYVKTPTSKTRQEYANFIASYFCCLTCGGLSYGACRYKITSEPRAFDRPIDEYLKEMMGDRLEAFKTKGQIVLKFFEITAAGSLLIAGSQTTEMSELGLNSGVNYIAVDKNTALDTIKDCCVNPEKYESIRHNGWEWSKKHTMQNREIQLEQILC